MSGDPIQSCGGWWESCGCNSGFYAVSMPEPNFACYVSEVLFYFYFSNQKFENHKLASIIRLCVALRNRLLRGGFFPRASGVGSEYLLLEVHNKVPMCFRLGDREIHFCSIFPSWMSGSMGGLRLTFVTPGFRWRWRFAFLWMWCGILLHKECCACSIATVAGI